MKMYNIIPVGFIPAPFFCAICKLIHVKSRIVSYKFFLNTRYKNEFLEGSKKKENKL